MLDWELLTSKYRLNRFQVTGADGSSRLLKVTLKNVKEDYKVVIVAPTSHFYWNLASVRGPSLLSAITYIFVLIKYQPSYPTRSRMSR